MQIGQIAKRSTPKGRGVNLILPALRRAVQLPAAHADELDFLHVGDLGKARARATVGDAIRSAKSR